MKKDPDAINDEQMQHLVQSNEKNIMDITNILDQLEKQQLEEKVNDIIVNIDVLILFLIFRAVVCRK